MWINSIDYNYEYGIILGIVLKNSFYAFQTDKMFIENHNIKCFSSKIRSYVGILTVAGALIVSPIISLGSDFNPGASAPANGVPPYGANTFNTASVISSGAVTSTPVNSSPSNAVGRSGGSLRDSSAIATIGASSVPSASGIRNGASAYEGNARANQGSALNQANSNFNVTSASTAYTESTTVAYQTASVVEATEAPAVPELPRTGGGGRARK